LWAGENKELLSLLCGLYKEGIKMRMYQNILKFLFIGERQIRFEYLRRVKKREVTKDKGT
jgi:hypothetical protein